MKRKWTSADLQSLADKGVSVVGFTPVTVPPALKAKKANRKKPKALQEMERLLYILGYRYEVEYQFLESRKYRFDIALPEHKIGIEYEGLMSEKSRHTSITGYTGDCTKYNLAQIAGWRVLRYTVINHKDIITELEQMIK